MNLKSLLLAAPEGQIDEHIKKLIQKWDDTAATPIQILEALDATIHGGGASKFILTVLQMEYDAALNNTNTTHEDVAKHATWRK